jgi:hypothetical protein
MPLESKTSLKRSFKSFASNTGGGATIYRVTNAVDANKGMGHCSMRGRLLQGELLLRFRKSGDNFYDFAPIEQIENGTMADFGLAFGAYNGFGKEEAGWMDAAEVCKLIDDGFIYFSDGAPKFEVGENNHD